MRSGLVVLSIVVGCLASAPWDNFGGVAVAQVPTAPANSHNKYGSPLDTLMSSRLWTDVPQARDFVRESRPDAKTLDYEPLTGTDPQRPKPRDKANVEALQAELEHDGALNARKGGGLAAPKSSSTGHRRRKSMDGR